jgi:guanine nucleotide exchange factor
MVRDMFDFENIAFAHTVGDFKYLTCADCEREVLGVQLLTAPGKPIYLCCSRVKYL